MLSRAPRVRLSLRIVLIACAAVLASVQTGSAIGTQSTYSFTGTCSDCNNPSGTLVLQNYTLGQPLSSSNFVSFTYSSSVISFTISAAANPSFDISGTLPATLPGPSANTVVIDNGGTPEFMGFIAETNSDDGDWCAGPECEFDEGTGGTWSLGAAPPTSNVPALNTEALAGTALLLALMGWFLLKRLPRRSASHTNG